jgi:transcriptional regulator with XRE-family HTH domain
VNAQTWAEFLTAVAGPDAPTANQSEIARVAGVSTATVSRWVSGDSRPKAEQVIGVARAYNVSPLLALVAAGYLEQAEVEGELDVPRALAIGEFTELELAQEMLRRVDRGEGAVLEQPVEVDHPAWAAVGGASQDEVHAMPSAAKSDARELEEDDHTP